MVASWGNISDVVYVDNNLTINGVFNSQTTLKDSILGTSHLRFPKFMCNVENKNLNFLKLFSYQITAFKQRKRIYSNQICMFYLNDEFSKKIMQELSENPFPGQFGDIQSTREMVFSKDVCFRLFEPINALRKVKAGDYVRTQFQDCGLEGIKQTIFKEYNIMTNSTSFCWIDLIKRLDLEMKNATKYPL